MAGELGEVRLGEVAEIIMGQSPPGETYTEQGCGLPFFQGAADFNYRHPTPRVFCTAPSRVARPGDILLSVRAPIGRVNVADRECAIGRGLAIVRPRGVHDARYIEFALRYLEPYWHTIEGTGSVFGNATRTDVEGLRIPWPSKSERRAIAHILGTLDDKIELNRWMSETLEQMALQYPVKYGRITRGEAAELFRIGLYQPSRVLAWPLRDGILPRHDTLKGAWCLSTRIIKNLWSRSRMRSAWKSTSPVQTYS